MFRVEIQDNDIDGGGGQFRRGWIWGVIDSGLKFYSGSDVVKVNYWAAAAELVPTAAPPVLKL
jgi:hypothetical protein